jgi:chaperonin GroES
MPSNSLPTTGEIGSRRNLMANEAGLELVREREEAVQAAAALKKDKRAKAIASLNVEPLNDRVIVLREEAEEDEMIAGGLLVKPQVTQDVPHRATVVAVGPGRVLDSGVRVPMHVWPGATVLIGHWSGSALKIGETEFTVLAEDEIYGIVREPGYRPVPLYTQGPGVAPTLTRVAGGYR